VKISKELRLSNSRKIQILSHKINKKYFLREKI
jgi:hypothetical protein